MYDENFNEIYVARHPQQIIYIKIPYQTSEYDILRKVNEEA